jgi:hypothetical protein
MVKEAKFFRKQAAKAERMARTVADAEISERYLNMAKGYRSQADVLKAKKKPRLKAKKGVRQKATLTGVAGNLRQAIRYAPHTGGLLTYVALRSMAS